MRGISITDSTPDGSVLTVDLVDILRLLGPLAIQTEWEVADVESVGGASARELERLAEAGTRVPGQTLLSLVDGVTQIIDGKFAGYRDGEDQPWIIVRAVDSSAFDVESEDEAIVSALKRQFKSVTELDAIESPAVQQRAPREPLAGPRSAGG